MYLFTINLPDQTYRIESTRYMFHSHSQKLRKFHLGHKCHMDNSDSR